MRKVKKVAVLGCGNGGMALAADLKLKGLSVGIWSDIDHSKKLNSILENNKQIVLQEKHENTIVDLDLVSTDLNEIIDFGEVIYNCTPMIAHVGLFKEIISCLSLNEELKILINLSGVFSSVDQLLNTQDKSIFNTLKIFDSSSFPYACRAGEHNKVSILGRKFEIPVASLFSADIKFLSYFSDHFGEGVAHQIDNPFKLGLMGTNAILHPSTVLFNARLIENGCSFKFYQEGISKKTSLLHEALDKERLWLAKMMGYDLRSCAQEYEKFYNDNFENIYDFYIKSSAHENIDAPNTLAHRFVTEDIAYALVPLISLGKIYDINLHNIESLVTIFSTIMGVDYYQRGRNLFGITKKIINQLSWKNCTPETVLL